LCRTRRSTPFLKEFGSLLFGRPPVSALAKFSECGSLSLLANIFGSHIPKALLDRKLAGENSRNRLFSLDVVFWRFSDQVQAPG
jgi:hypothetical protein